MTETETVNYWIVDSSGTMRKEGFDSYAQALWGLNERAKLYGTMVTPIVNGQFSYYDPTDDRWYEVTVVPNVEDDGA